MPAGRIAWDDFLKLATLIDSCSQSSTNFTNTFQTANPTAVDDRSEREFVMTIWLSTAMSV
jgi:hypothetical protein